MRVFLFVLMQLAVLVVVGIVGGIVLNLLGLDPSRDNYLGMFVICAIYGFAGSFISLFMSKYMCKVSYGVKVITDPKDRQERMLLDCVGGFAAKYGLRMPEVGIYESDDPNAFATGANRNSALVAVSRGLLRRMDESEIRGVLGHEMSHVHNGDMVTMALLQGVLNTFVYFFSRIVAYVVAAAVQGKNRSSGSSFFIYHGVNMLMQVCFGFLASLILMAYSRHREYKADAGSAYLSGGTADMIKALKALMRSEPTKMDGRLAAMCISGPKSVSALLRSHPPLTDRIRALEELRQV